MNYLYKVEQQLNILKLHLHLILVTYLFSNFGLTSFAEDYNRSDLYNSQVETLLNQLSEVKSYEEAKSIKEKIWHVWLNHHRNETIRMKFRKALNYLEKNLLELADTKFTEILTIDPNHTEAWNKRATLRFAQERYHESLADILRTLELEPRHFGAISGFGQICLRLQDPQSAMIAFEQALNINPNLTAIKDTIEMLKKEVVHNVH